MNGQAKFLTALMLTPQPDGCTWRVDGPFAYAPAAGGHITIPTGFITDLASIPKLFWNILPPFGKYTDAAILHDWLYRHQGKVGGLNLSRKQCDDLLREAMGVCGVPAWQIWIIYRAVRAFGWSAWNNEPRRTAIQKINQNQ